MIYESNSMLNKNYTVLTLISGLILGLFATLSPGSLFCFLIFILVISALQLFSPEEDRHFLIQFGLAYPSGSEKFRDSARIRHVDHIDMSWIDM